MHNIYYSFKTITKNISCCSAPTQHSCLDKAACNRQKMNLNKKIPPLGLGSLGCWKPEEYIAYLVLNLFPTYSLLIIVGNRLLNLAKFFNKYNLFQ